MGNTVTHCPVCNDWILDAAPCQHMQSRQLGIELLLIKAQQAGAIQIIPDGKTSDCNYCNGTGMLAISYPCIACGGGE